MKTKYVYYLVITCVFVLGYMIGRVNAVETFKDRAKDLPDDIECFTNQDIEHILYDTPLQTKRD